MTQEPSNDRTESQDLSQRSTGTSRGARPVMVGVEGRCQWPFWAFEDGTLKHDREHESRGDPA